MNSNKIRSIGLNCTFNQIMQIFGVDTAMFFQYYFIFIILLSIQFVCLIPFLIIYLNYDLSKINFNRQHNEYIILYDVATGSLSSFYWCVILFMNILYFFFIKRLHLKILHHDDLLYRIEDYSVIIHNIPKNLSSFDICQQLENIIEQNSIVTTLRVEDPSILRQRQNYFELQKKYYDDLQYNKQNIFNSSRLQKFIMRLSDKHKMFIKLQKLRIQKDALYYDTKLLKLRDKINKKVAKNLSEKEGIVIVFNTVQQKQYCLALKKLKINDDWVKIKKSYSPDDIIYPNISITNRYKKRQSILAYFILIIISGFLFITIKLARDKQYNYITAQRSLFMRTIVNGLTIFGIVQIPVGFRPLVTYLAEQERHASYSGFLKSKFVKYYIFTMFNKLSILYYRGFADLISVEQENVDPYEQLRGYFGIFSKSRSWRFGPNTPGRDLILIMISYIYGYNFVLWLIFQISLWVQKIQNQHITGISVQISQVYVNNFVVFTLVQCYAFQQPLMIPFAIIYYITNYYLVKYYQVYYGKILPDTNKLTITAQFTSISITCGSFIALIQFNFGEVIFLWLILMLLCCIMSYISYSDWFNKFISKYMKSTFTDDQYILKHNPPYHQVEFDKYYQLPEQLHKQYLQNMQSIIIHTKYQIAKEIERTFYSYRTIEWSKNQYNPQYNLHKRDISILVSTQAELTDIVTSTDTHVDQEKIAEK